MTLREFLLARRLEEETVVQAQLGIVHPHPDGWWLGPFHDERSRLLAEYTHARTDQVKFLSSQWAPVRLNRALRVTAFRIMAAEYVSHPDWRPEWRP